MTIQRISTLIVLALCLTALPVTASPGAGPNTPAGVQAATSSNGENVDFMGRIGGQVKMVSIIGSTAYLISSGEIVAVNVANPAQPAVISRRLVPSDGDYTVAGSTLYVGDTVGRLRIYDLQDPASLTEVAVYPLPTSSFTQGTGWSTRDIQVQGRYVYLLKYNPASYATIMQIIDVAQPAAPVQVGVFELSSWPSIVTVAGNYAYVGTSSYSATVQIINVANPAAPVSAGVYNVGGYANMTLLQVVGTRLYMEAAYPNNQHLTVIDVSNPAAPVKLGAYASDDPTTHEPGLIGIQGTYAYVHRPTTHGVQAVDLANPAAPVERGTLDLGPNGSGIRLGQVQGQYAYLVDVTPGGQTLLHVVNLTNPAVPQAGGALLIHPFSHAGQAAASGDSLYVTVGDSFDQHWLQRFSLANPLAPSAGISRTLDFRPTSLVVADGYAYLAAVWEHKVVVIDVANPAMPVVATYLLDEGIGWRVIAVEGRRAYVNYGSQLVVIDFTTLSAPRLLGSYSGYFWNDVFVANGTAWYMRYSSETYPGTCWLSGVDLSNPAAPQEIANLKLDSLAPCDYAASRLASSGTMLYVATSNDRLRVFDISNRALPALVASRSITMQVSAIHVQNDTVYVENATSLVLFDRSTAAGMPRVGAISLVIEYRSLEQTLVRNGVIYRTGSGLTILRQRTLAASGAVSQPNGQPFAGVTLAASSGASQLVDASGAFLFQDLPRGPLTFTPSKAGYVFWPPSRTADLPPNAWLYFQVTAPPVAGSLPPGTQRSLAFTDTQGLPTTFVLDTTAPSATSTVVITPTPSPAPMPGFAFAGHAFALAADPAVAVTATIRYSPADLRLASDPAALALWRWTGSGWAALECAEPALHDPAARSLTVGLCGPGAYALFAPTHQLLLPVLPAQ